MSRLATRTERLREIEALLFRRGQGMRVEEIAAECGVNRRTVYRDLEFLSDSGVPIWQENGCYGIIRDQYLATVRLKFYEALALYIAARLLARHSDEHNPHIVSALLKLATAFPATLVEYISGTAETIKERPVNRSYLANLEDIASCWARLTKIKIWYRSPRSGEVRPRTISPYTIEPSTTGGLYVIAYDEWANAIRTFKLDRVERVEPLSESYRIPPDFDLSAHFADAWGIMSGPNVTQVELRFSAAVAAYIRERIWHPSQQLTELPDGSIVLSVRISEPSEMRPWIRSWGAEVELLAPESLRQEMADEARRLAALYEITC